MKMHQLVRPMMFGLLSFSLAQTACETKNNGEAETAAPPTEAAKPMAEAPTPPPPPPAPAVATPSPTEVCTALLAAAKTKDEPKVLALSAPSTAAAWAGHGAKEHLLMSLGSATTCGAAKTEGDSATVAVTVGGATHDVMFVKVMNSWKFDGAAYLTKYPVMAEKPAKEPMKAPAKGGKAKKHKK